MNQISVQLNYYYDSFNLFLSIGVIRVFVMSLRFEFSPFQWFFNYIVLIIFMFL